MSEDTIREAIEQRLKKAQEKKEYKDTEKRVFGTRKEMAALKLIRMSDLEAIEKNPELAVDMVKKDKVFPKLNIEKEIDKGVSGGTAYLKWKMRYYYASAAANNKNSRLLYVSLVTEIINQFWECVGIDEFKNKLDNWDLFTAIVKAFDSDRYEELKSEYDEQWYAKNQYNKWYQENKYKQGVTTHSETEKKLQELNVKLWNDSELKKVFRDIITESWMDDKYATYTYGQERLLKYLLINSAGDKWMEIFVQQRGIGRLISEANQYEPVTQEQVDQYNENLNPTKERLASMISAAASLKLSIESQNVDTLKNLLTDKQWISNSQLSAVQLFNSKDGKYYSIEDIAALGYPKLLIDWYAESATNAVNNRIQRLINSVTHGMANAPVVRGSTYTFAQKTKSKASATEEGEDTQKEPEIEINVGVPLAHLKRIGGYSIIEDDIAVNTIIEKFGFASVTFGNYVKDKEAKEHLRHFLGAVSDLGDILNMDIISLNRLNKVTKLGGLSMWFGAGGRGGRAMAYFRAAGCVINLTKSRGDGTVAHEYAHYLDNALAIMAFQSGYYDATDDTRMFASVTRIPYKGNRKFYDPNSPDRESYRQSKMTFAGVETCIREIMSFIYDNNLSDSFKLQHPELVENYTGLGKNQIKTTVEAYDKGSFEIRKPGEKEPIEQYMEWFYGRYYQFRDSRNNTPRNLKILGYIVKLYGLKSYDFIQTAYGSRYYLASSRMKSDYWTRAWELFARAFETYIFDKLAEKGRVNNYLVSGDYFSFLVYPQDQERKILFALYDNLMQAIKRDLQIPDFKPVRNERVDEYIDFDENAEVEAVENGIVVDDKTKNVVIEVSDTASIQTKLQALLNLLEGNSEAGRASSTPTEMILGEPVEAAGVITAPAQVEEMLSDIKTFAGVVDAGRVTQEMRQKARMVKSPIHSNFKFYVVEQEDATYRRTTIYMTEASLIEYYKEHKPVDPEKVTKEEAIKAVMMLGKILETQAKGESLAGLIPDNARTDKDGTPKSWIRPDQNYYIISDEGTYALNFEELMREYFITGSNKIKDALEITPVVGDIIRANNSLTNDRKIIAVDNYYVVVQKNQIEEKIPRYMLGLTKESNDNDAQKKWFKFDIDYNQ